MANEIRLRQMFVAGQVDDNPLTAGALVFNSGGLAAVTNGVDSAHYLPIALDPDGVDGAPEIIWVTALTAGATTSTILRGQEGTTARQHAQGTPWVHCATLLDVGDAAWTAYTPSWTADTVNPTIGNGVLKGAYQLIGKNLYFRITMQFGSTSTQGTGGWFFGIPSFLTSKNDSGSRQVVSAWCLRNSPLTLVAAVARLDWNTNTLRVNVANNQAGNVGNGLPWPWAANDEVQITGVIEVN